MEGVILVEPTRITHLKEVIEKVGTEHTGAIESLVIAVYEDWLNIALNPGYSREDLIAVAKIGINQIKEYKSWENVPNWSEVEAGYGRNEPA